MRLFRKGTPSEAGVEPAVMAEFFGNLMADKVLIEVKPVQDLIGELQTMRDEDLIIDEDRDYWRGYDKALDVVINMLKEMTYA